MNYAHHNIYSLGTFSLTHSLTQYEAIIQTAREACTHRRRMKSGLYIQLHLLFTVHFFFMTWSNSLMKTWIFRLYRYSYGLRVPEPLFTYRPRHSLTISPRINWKAIMGRPWYVAVFSCSWKSKAPTISSGNLGDDDNSTNTKHGPVACDLSW